jgi:two-component system, LytTR family, sensor kinase
MKISRIGHHLLFWLAYLSICLFNDLYSSPSFNAHPGLELFLQAFSGQVILLLIKGSATYYFLYSWIPRWLNESSKTKLLSEALFVVLFSVGMMRAFMYLIIWPLIFRDQAPSLTTLQFIARYFYSFLELMQVLGVAVALKLFRLRIAAIEKEKMLVQEKLRSELLHLRTQINPHFLFNTLNVIFSLSRSGSEKTSEAVTRLSNILRYRLYETERPRYGIAEELKVIQDYIELQQLRFGEKLDIQIKKNIDDENTLLTPLIILPLVENVFKHGSSVGRVEICLHLEKGKLQLKIRNPISETVFKLKGEEGIGLSGIKRQLELLYKDFSLKFGPSQNEFHVDLRIDLFTYAGLELFNSRR